MDKTQMMEDSIRRKRSHARLNEIWSKFPNYYGVKYDNLPDNLKFYVLKGGRLDIENKN